MIQFFLFLILNFGISWFNARGAGRVWSESKEIGGMLRVHAVIAYVMAIMGFTMVYGSLILLALPTILPLVIEGLDADMMWNATQLTSDLLYVIVATFVVPAGFFVWFTNVVSFWKRRTLAEGLRLSYNTFAQIRNTVSVARHAPSALSRIATSLFGGKGKKKGNAAVVLIALLTVIVAVFGGYFTAAAILKRADEEYDLFEGMKPQEEVEEIVEY